MHLLCFLVKSAKIKKIKATYMYLPYFLGDVTVNTHFWPYTVQTCMERSISVQFFKNLMTLLMLLIVFFYRITKRNGANDLKISPLFKAFYKH